MKRKDSNDLTNSPSTATDDRSQGVQGPPNKPGQYDKDDAGRVTKEAYLRGRRAGEPKAPKSDDQATRRSEDRHGEKRNTM